MSTEIILAPALKLDKFSIAEPLTIEKNAVLERTALIGRVSNLDSKTLAVRAQRDLKTITAAVEKARKQAKEPLLEAGRQLDTACASFVLEIEKEFCRVSNLVQEFDNEERRRVAEEERLQRAELERIEREKQAEIDRLAREQAAREAEARRVQEEAARLAREAAAAAERLASEARGKKQREAAQAAQAAAAAQAALAETARLESERMAAEERAKLAAQTAAIEEKAADAAYVAAKPVEITKVSGQRTTINWEITSINEHVLYRARPDLATKIEFDMRALKAELSKGIKLAGVTAKEVYKADVRLPVSRTVDV